MTMTISSGRFNLTIVHDEDIKNYDTLLKSSNRSFNYKIVFSNSDTHAGSGIRGDDAIWVPFNQHRGIKLFKENNRYISLEESLKTIKLIEESGSEVFPVIYDSGVFEDETTKEKYVFIEMENVEKQDQIAQAEEYLSFVPSEHRQYVSSALNSDIAINSIIAEELSALDLCPEDEWYKSINCINGKIVDFHRFEIKPSRYNLPCQNLTPVEIEKIYKTIVSRYTSVLDSSGLPKWKGKIYQGFNFSNGSTMKGYTSDFKIFDSYKKMPFIPLNKSKNKKDLDLG